MIPAKSGGGRKLAGLLLRDIGDGFVVECRGLGLCGFVGVL
jgi:hypothetical protein